MPLVKAYVAPNFLRKQTYKQTTKLPAGANATYEISVMSYTFIKKWSEVHFQRTPAKRRSIFVGRGAATLQSWRLPIVNAIEHKFAATK